MERLNPPRGCRYASTQEVSAGVAGAGDAAAGLGQWTSQIARSGLPADVGQVVILTVGAAWSAAYEVDAYSSAARVAGVPDDAIHAILQGTPPPGLRPETEVAYQLSTSLLTDRSVPDELYSAAIDTFGEARVITILSLIGQYQTVSPILVSFRVPVAPSPPGHPERTATAAKPVPTHREQR